MYAKPERSLSYYCVGPHAQPAADGETKPARFLEQRLGISGISGNYNYTPEDVAAYHDIYDRAYPYIRSTCMDDNSTFSERFQNFAGTPVGVECHGQLKKLWNDLCAKNEILMFCKVDPQNIEMLCDALDGIVSDFNLEDINYFLSMSSVERRATDTVAWAREEEFYRPGWKISPATVSMVDALLEDKGRREGNPFHKFTADHTGKITSGPREFLLRFM